MSRETTLLNLLRRARAALVEHDDTYDYRTPKELLDEIDRELVVLPEYLFREGKPSAFEDPVPHSLAWALQQESRDLEQIGFLAACDRYSQDAIKNAPTLSPILEPMHVRAILAGVVAMLKARSAG